MAIVLNENDLLNNSFYEFLRNTVKDKKVIDLLERNKDSEIRVMNIWGARYDKDIFRFHLGHAYVLQKLKDISIQKNLDVKLFIGINTDKEFSNYQRSQKQRLYIKCSEKLIIDACGIDGKTKISDLSVFKDENKDKYKRIINIYSDILDKISNRYASQSQPNILIENIDWLINMFGVTEKNAKEININLNNFYNKSSNKLKSNSEKLLRLQLFIYTHMHVKPHFILVSLRHEYHWKFYLSIFKIAKIKPIPQMLYLDSFLLPNESDVMKAAKLTSIYLTDKNEEVRDKLNEAATSYETFLRQCYNYIIFPATGSIKIKNDKNVIGVLDSPYNLCKYRKSNLDTYVYSECKNNLPIIIHKYKKIIEDTYKDYTKLNLRWISFSNVESLNNINNRYNADLEQKINEHADEINLHPENCGDLYWGIINALLKYYKNKNISINNSDSTLDDLSLLMTKIRSMDFYLWLTEKKYRDHFSHMLNVANGGLIAIDAIKNNHKSLKEVILEINEEFNNDSLEQLWIFTALLHDHAYPISHYLRFLGSRMHVINSQLSQKLRDAELGVWKKLAKSLGDYISQIAGGRIKITIDKLSDLHFTKIEEFKDYICRELGEIVTESVPCEYEKMSLEEKWQFVTDHGVLGCLNIYESTGSTSKLCHNTNQWSHLDFMADAIYVHNNPGLKPKINFNDNPFAYILILIDEIQEWGRNALGDKDYKQSVSDVEIGPFIYDNDGKINIINNELKIIFNVADSSQRKELKWDIDYFESSKDKAFGRLILPIVDIKNNIILESLSYETKVCGKIFKAIK